MYRKRKIRREAFLKKVGKPANIDKLTRLQAFIRGSMTRIQHKEAILKVKTEAPKKTTSYKRLAKLQANIRGWLFRQRRKRLLSKIKPGNMMSSNSFQDGFIGDEDEFDAEAFFGVKEENFNTNIGIDDDLMMKAIEIMTAQNPAAQA